MLWVTLNLLPGNFPVGHRIRNRYRLKRYLGGGVNGRVYEVWDERQEQTVALKLMLKAAPAGVWTEATVLTGLRGDFILPILNADDDAGVPFIVTEVMRNGSVDDRNIPNVGVDVDQAARWIQQASLGVARIHDRNLLHNDIKPANLFLDGDDNVLVGDLGLACLMNANGNGHAAGTPSTMAPEVARAKPTTVRSDVYSLGATLYEMLAGHHLNPSVQAAINAGAPPSKVYDIVSSHVPAPLGNVAPHVPLGLRQIVMKAISPEPAERYETPTELAAAIGARTRPRRTWRRDAPCTGHTTCFTGTRAGASTFKVCAVPSGVRDRHTVEARRLPAGTRINPPWPEVTRGKLVQELRTRMRDLT